MIINTKSNIKYQAIQNLLTCQKVAAEKGDAKATIIITKYLLKTIDNLKSEIFDLVMEEDHNRTDDPPQSLKENI